VKTRRSAFKKTKRLFVVATEGAETEPIYFQEFHPGRDGGFRLRILGNPKHKSRPVEVVQRIRRRVCGRAILSMVPAKCLKSP